MPWNTPVTWTPNTVLGATQLNAQLRDNMNFVLNGKAMSYLVYNYGGSTTTSLTFVDVDATNLKVTGNLTSGRALVFASFVGLTTLSGGGGYFDVIVDNTTRAGGVNGLAWIPYANLPARPITMVAYFSGLSVGSHTFKMQYRLQSAGNAVGVDSCPVVMMLMEL
jgi:hypothetical protein